MLVAFPKKRNRQSHVNSSAVLEPFSPDCPFVRKVVTVQTTRAPKTHVLVSKGCCLGTGGWDFDKNAGSEWPCSRQKAALLPWAPTAGEPSRLKANGSTAPATGTAASSHVLLSASDCYLLKLRVAETTQMDRWAHSGQKIPRIIQTSEMCNRRSCLKKAYYRRQQNWDHLFGNPLH